MAKKYSCENCSFRRYADKRPQSILARLWRWHTGWCPGWKAYQKALAADAAASGSTKSPG